MTSARRILGSETQGHHEQTGVSGLSRVTRETHVGLDVRLRPLGFDLVPVHTRVSHGHVGPHRNAYLAMDPVLDRPLHDVEDVDALLILGLTMSTDFGRILRLRRERGLPTIAMVHDIMPLLHPDWFPPRARAHYRAYLQQLLHVSDHVIVSTADVRSALLGPGWRMTGEVQLMPLGSHFTQQPPSPASDGPLSMLYVSTVAPHKGHRLLLDAFDLLRRRDDSTQLTIVGRQGWMAEQIAAAITAHPAYGSTLRWERFASDHAILEIARRCNVAVIPAEAEGHGLWLEEGLTLGLATVARDLPVFRERAAYPNLTLAGPTPESFAQAITSAHATRPRPLEPCTIRSMKDFCDELAYLALSVLS